jgi:hypothetical protein
MITFREQNQKQLNKQPRIILEQGNYDEQVIILISVRHNQPILEQVTKTTMNAHVSKSKISEIKNPIDDMFN